MPVVESLSLVSFGRPRNVSWHPYAKRHLGCVRASIFPLPARLCAVLCWKKSLNFIFSPFPWRQNYFFPTGNWRLCSNSTAGWSIGRCFGFKMGLSCWSQLLVFSYCHHPLGCCQWCSTSTCDPVGFGTRRRWVGLGKWRRKTAEKCHHFGKTLNGLPSHHRMNSNSLHRVVLISGSLLGPQINQKISLELSPE